MIACEGVREYVLVGKVQKEVQRRKVEGKSKE